MSEQIVERLKKYFEERPDLGVASVYLFGSQAEGRAHRESDIDVAVLLDWHRYPTRRERLDLRVSLSSELIGALNHNEVDVVILNDAPPPLGRKIIYDGIRVYVAVQNLAALPEFSGAVVRGLSKLPGFRNGPAGGGIRGLT